MWLGKCFVKSLPVLFACRAAMPWLVIYALISLLSACAVVAKHLQMCFGTC